IEGSATTAFSLGALDAFPENDRPAPIECTRQHELLQHSVDAVEWLVDVFEDQNAVGDVGSERSSAQRREHGEISADQSPFGVSVTDFARIGCHAARIGLQDDSPQK